MVQVSSLLDASTLSLVYIEIQPRPTEKSDPQPFILAAVVKIQLLNLSCQTCLSTDDESKRELKIQLLEESGNGQRGLFQEGRLFVDDGDNHDCNDSESSAVLQLPQLNPLLPSRWPCKCVAYVKVEDKNAAQEANCYNALIEESTMIRVVPSRIEPTDYLLGDVPSVRSAFSDILDNQNKETVQELTILLMRLLKEPILVGTGPDSCASSRIVPVNQPTKQWNPPKVMDFRRDGALFVHSPDHGAGKTLLVEHLARSIGCTRVHKIHIGSIISKHGVFSDVALESILHQIVLSAALHGGPVCIILDHFSAMMPPSFSASSGAGDPIAPILSSIAAHLRFLTYHLFHDKVFPFPSKNPLYNVHGKNGHDIPVRLCLVAVATCPDDGWKSVNLNMKRSTSTNIFNVLVAAKYRLPPLTAATRLRAFQNAMKRQGLDFSMDLEHRLSHLAASAVWACGGHFMQVAGHVQNQVAPKNCLATEENFVLALQHVRKSNAIAGATVEFLADQGGTSKDNFGSIGGNVEAKIALTEALAMDKQKRNLLARFGMSPPTGVLLFGPPGTGKTLLAKAVAKLLKNNSSLGGAFVSINSTDVARAEVGTGEKILAAAFETARSNAPAVVFIDEFQALFTDRSSGGSSRVTSTLLTSMDDCKTWAKVDQDRNQEDASSKRVIILAATNTPWMIDKALLRPGRFDRIVHVGLPNENERYSILKLLIKKMESAFRKDEEELDHICNGLAGRTQGFSGADLAALCRNAAVLCLVEESSMVRGDHFDQALQETRPNSSIKLVEKIKEWRPR